MSFLLACPNCGPRGVYEFRYGGEYNPRPNAPTSMEEWSSYLYLKTNVAGVQEEWWFHRMGCRHWFRARRDTVSNTVLETYWAPGAAKGEPEEQAVQGRSVEP